MSECRAIKANGESCRGIAVGSSGWCYQHSPEHAEERKRNASRGGRRGGRGRPLVEVGALKGQLSDLYTSVLEGGVEPKVGAVAAQIAGAQIRLLETERKIKELEELEARIAALEEGDTP